MNKQNFEARDRFPLSTQALSFMQDMIMATAQLALIGGDNYILSGCTITGDNVSDGVIVINGEVMPFKGGAKVNTITIVEEPIQVSANGLTFENARVKRYAKFASGTGANYYPWSIFQPLPTNEQLEKAKATVEYVDQEIAKIQAGNIPTGVIVMWGGREADIPTGWCLCDGRTLSDGTRVPDLKGRFIVGYNPTIDSGYSSIGAGTKKADQYKVTLTKKEMPSHNHGIGNKDGSVNAGAPGLARKSNGKTSNTSDHCDPSPNEPDILTPPSAIPYEGDGMPFDIRPPYYVLAFIIKVNV